MPQSSHAPGCLAVIDELVRLTAPPAAEREIAEQGLALLAGTLRAARGALFLKAGARPFEPVLWGSAEANELLPMATRAMRASDIIEERSRGAANVAVPLLGTAGPIGAIVLMEA